MLQRRDSSDTASIELGYPVRRERWTLAGRRFDVTWPADMDALLDAPETQRRFDRDDYMPYWAQPWPIAVLMAERVLAGPGGARREAIELGCGVGIVSIAAAYADWRIVATDYDADAVRFARLNAERSGVMLADARVLDYRERPAAPAYDLILGSDLLYERKKVEPVAAWIAAALRPGGEALIGDPNRSAADGLPDALAALGLSAEVEAGETVSPAGMVIRGRIWRVGWQGDAGRSGGSPS